MSEQNSNIIGFIAMIVSLFAKKHHVGEAVAYHCLDKSGAAALLINHYGYLHTQDYDQVVDDLSDYCRRHGTSLS